MLKFADRISEDKRNRWNSSYSNSVFSEKVCCDILHELGFPVQNVLLGYVTFSSEKKPVVACENFIPTGATLVSFKTIANSILSTKLGKLPKISEISCFSRAICLLLPGGRSRGTKSLLGLIYLRCFSR